MAASNPKQPKSAPITSKKTLKTPSNKRKGKESNIKSIPAPNHVEPWSAPSWENDTPWNWASLTDPSSSRIPPVFTKDGSYFFSLVGSSVKIHSTATGLVVSTLSAPPVDGNAQSDSFTSAILNPHNAFQLITGSLDGRVMIWDFINATLLQTIDVSQPIHHICGHEQFKGSIFVAVSLSRKKAADYGEFAAFVRARKETHVSEDKNAAVMQILLRASNHTSQHMEITSVGKIRLPSGLAISSNGVWLVAAAGHTIYVAKTSSLLAGFTKYVSPERLRCLAFHPSEEYFATGDEKGVIRLWYCLNDNLAINAHGVEKRTQTRPLHWHAHAVSSLSFTPNGAYLLSGGEEAVLVIWQLHTGRKEFVPRLGAPIGTVSVLSTGTGEEEYLLGLTDATYTFVGSSTLKVTRSYSRIKIDPAQSQAWKSPSKLNTAPLAVQPVTKTLILPSSHPSSLQMYSASGSTLLGELEISPSNRVSRRDDKPLIFAHVDTTVISSSGSWMATIDSREADAGFHSDVYLKLWLWDKSQDNWVLNTRIDRPHGTDKITDASFSPVKDGGSPLQLVTTGEDGRIKVWRLWKHPVASGSKTLAQSENETWTSFSSFNYRTEIPTSVSWSPDASLFAVSVGTQIAIYDSMSATLCQTLTSPNSDKTMHVHFIGNSGRYLLATHSRTLVMWDLVNSNVAWQTVTPENIDKIVPHQKEDSFAVFHSPTTVDDERRTRISIFQALSNVPVSVHSVPFGLRNVVWSPFNAESGFSLVGITSSWRVVTLGDSKQVLKDEGLTAKAMHTQQNVQKRTLFQDIFGTSAFASTSNADLPQAPSLQRKDKLDDIFDTPVYLAPSLDDLFNPLIKSFLTLRTSEPKLTDDSLEDDVDEDIIMQDEQNAATVTSNHPSRVPNPGEMVAFTNLFRTMTGTLPLLPKVNVRLNGVLPKEINGAPRATDTPVSRLKRLPTQVDLPVTNTASPSPLVGKKRKKASS